MPGDGLVGQGWLELIELAAGFALSALIGLEREIRQKAAGLRTYTLVGLASTVFMLISKYGFMDVLSRQTVVVDPSRVASGIVTGIGFIGGGVIFVRSDIVRGLTTAASVWLVAAVGMACGAGMLILAAAVTLGYFVIAIGFPVIFGLLPTSRWSVLPLSVFYEDGRGILREVLGACSSHGFTISKVYVGKSGSPAHGKARDDALSSHGRAPPIVNVSMSISGGRQVPQLLEEISAIPGVISVSGGRPEERE